MAKDHIEIINLKKKLSAAGIDVTLLQAAVTILQGQVPPAGGNANEVLMKDTNVSYDFSWQALPTSGLTQAQVLARTL